MKPRGERNALSRREEEVLRLAASGLTDQQIANSLGIRVSTVTTYWIRIRSKVGQLNRAELIALCVRQKSQEAVNELRNEVVRLRAENSDLTRAVVKTVKRAEVGLAALDEVPCGVLVVRQDGSLLLGNRAASDLLGYEDGELELVHLGDVLPAPHDVGKPMPRQVISACKKDGSHMSLQVEMKPFEGGLPLLLCVLSKS